jgi:4-hydroxy-3-methylbut-2-enyl diphosphate reductase IspH
MKEIIYEPHPVTPERKAELVSQGYQIIDAQFAPVGEYKPKQEKRQKQEKKIED